MMRNSNIPHIGAMSAQVSLYPLYAAQYEQIQMYLLLIIPYPPYLFSFV
jgi:hypothetical protein